jgi:7,8-dihydropterin-6-yl-methyl-4-(beta-D-ribofuranosyl)aminobenzene 5'-phosphate synthase
MYAAGSLLLFLGLVTPPTTAAAGELTMTNVYDAFGKTARGLEKDFGFSAVVRYRGKTVLFDAGTRADIFGRNLRASKTDPRKIDAVVISHSHHDHIAGVDYLLSVNPRVKIYLPKDFFGLGAPMKFPFAGPEPEVARTLPVEQCYFDCARDIQSKEVVSTGRFWKANVEYVETAREILPGVTLIPTVSELMGTFMRYPPNGNQPRLIGMPELSVSFQTERGDVLVVGCSHSSVEAIVKSARDTSKRKIHLLAGGFHLIPYDRSYVTALAGRLKGELGVETIAPAHCTGSLAFAIFRESYGTGYRFFGLGETLGL